MAVTGLALLGLLLAIALRTGEATGAEGDGCTPTCVILIQVDGLEPKDLNQATTPYLWLLAHPNVQGQNVPGSALSQRSGWMWQAPRGALGGTGSATAALLTGGYPEKSGIPADDFYGPTSAAASFPRQRRTAGTYGDTAHPEAGPDVAEPIDAPAVDTLPGVVRTNGGDAAIFLGDPGLAKLTEAESQGNPHWFPPGDANSATSPEGQFTGDPRLCPVPRYPDGGASLPGRQPFPENFNPSHCPANDMTTMNKAASDLKLTENGDVGLTFIHLAELGATKRLVGDTDVDETDPDAMPDSSPPQVQQALSNMDHAVSTFVEQYAQARSDKWQKTVLMVVGSNGYQNTPLVNRVPDPDLSADQTRDLSDYVARYSQNGVEEGALRLVPQGTMATIYYGLDGKGEPADRDEALEAIKTDLETRIDEACEERKPTADLDGDDQEESGCLDAIYYVDRDEPGITETVHAANPTWRLDARNPDTGARTRASGDLVLVLKRGWAFGRAVGIPGQATLTGQPFTNPALASGGGPQERAVAALINGPGQANLPGAVRNLDSLATSQIGLTQLKHYPVSRNPVDPSNPDNPPPVNDAACPDTATDPGGLGCANDPSKVGDDLDDDGHEAQPETVDFALTISALMQLPFETHPDQLQGRVLQEAFLNKLATPCIGEECDPPVIEEPEVEPPPLPPPPPPEVIQPEGFNFHGLVRDLRARVVDSRNRTYKRAPRGTVLSTVRLEGDFGKPEAALTLTFYRRTSSRAPRSRRSRRAGRSRRSRVVRLKAIARFDPFIVKRGHVTMRLKIPPQFKPTYIGVVVREVARSGGRRRLSGGVPCTTVKTRKPVPFRCTGPSRALIMPIADAARLHKHKGGKRVRSRGRR